jgi:hypothetical protein
MHKRYENVRKALVREFLRDRPLGRLAEEENKEVEEHDNVYFLQNIIRINKRNDMKRNSKMHAQDI